MSENTSTSEEEMDQDEANNTVIHNVVESTPV